jgi:SAM-dependent methyltransferase
MQQKRFMTVAEGILDFVGHKYGQNALAAYTQRVHGLRQLQKEFERNGAYPATCYADVKLIEDDAYKISLLLSIICTNHRFEILQELQTFLQMPCAAPERLLSIGYGTGYELKLTRDILPDWIVEAFDNSETSHAFAAQLLRFFNCRPVTLKRELFPLESTADIQQFRGAFGKVVVCELLEHLEDPAGALRTLRNILHENGQIFLTMAVNIAQEDHVFLYSSADQARQQVLECGYRIVRERLTPAVMLPFDETEREKLFKKGNYVCVAERAE